MMRSIKVRYLTAKLSCILLVALGLSLGHAVMLHAEPQTKKVPMDLGFKTNKGADEFLQYILSLSENEMIAIIPEQSGIFYTRCPNCRAGTQDRGDWEWTPQLPRSIRCKQCKEVYPNNTRYPDSNHITTVSLHKRHSYPYYETPDGYRIFLAAHADYLARQFMEKTCRRLASLYRETGNDMYARRAALILLRFAEVFPGYAYKFDYPFKQKQFFSYRQSTMAGFDPFRVSKWTWWGYMDVSRELLQAYHDIKPWPGLKEMGNGNAVRLIEADLFGQMVRGVLEKPETYGNMSPGMWFDFVLAGYVLNRFDWVREVTDRLKKFYETNFLHDGYWMETSPSYCSQVTGNLTRLHFAIQESMQSSDRQDKTKVEVAERMQELSVVFDTIRTVQKAVKLPNGRDLPINDTWADTGSNGLNESKSLLMPGLGLAVLNTGKGNNQLTAWLNFTSGRMHKHKDALSIGLFAHGKELLSDIGYTHTKWRCWSQSTLSHNTVVVNGLDSALDPKHVNNRLRFFVTDGKGFHVVESENDSAYPGVTTAYRRACALIGSGSNDAYLLDIFQVTGGKQHDFLLHGSPAENSRARVGGVELKPYDGTLMNAHAEFREPKGEYDTIPEGAGYGFVRDISQSKIGNEITIDFRFESDPRVGITTHLLVPREALLFVGKAPRIRDAKNQDNLLDKFWAPFVCARVEGKDLSSRFIAVHEPVNSEAKVKSVHFVPYGSGGLVTVDRGNYGRDYFMVSNEENLAFSSETPDGVLKFDGQWGFARVQDHRCVEAHLVGGRFLNLGTTAISGQGRWSGQVNQVHRIVTKEYRGYFEIGEDVGSLAGSILSIEFPDRTIRAYNISKIERLDRGSRIYVVEDPGFTLHDSYVQLTTFPQRSIRGAVVKYHIASVANWRDQ
ncbi:heparinase II/III domain-containing protein [Desulfomonile tiedjei]|uniref:Heparinase II/III-like protein n=1 Tax=Desulfomonile tiedjei (strain ATCC 49306 / DSM 6799 / DCB-1) TaxID=706587 RepID=I4CBJ6_DESTA|nr:heparinase II/III family protein [Desulfomonile tiedjei]AFM26937.1 Heparinase II/III-like protein [Desulfomonile tiedjei DSM 6799]